MFTLLLLAAPFGAQVDPKELADVLGERWTPEARVYATAGPAVVGIDLTAEITQRSFFGPASRSRMEVGQGTGVIMDPSGLVITNAHVVAPEMAGLESNSVKIQVHFADEFGGQTYAADLLSLDREWDLALLKIQAKGPFRSIPLGSSADLIKGELVIAIGTPYGNYHSITSGILSGFHRNISVRTPRGQKTFSGLLQTDAAINPGNSGGPLLNALGELIGINSATLQAADGIGFAIPVDRVSEILGERLFDVDQSSRFWLGMRVEERDDGLRVVHVHPRGPAGEAGVREGDRVRKVGHKPVSRLQEYAALLLPLEADQTLSIEVLRNGRPQAARLRLRPSRDRETVGLLGFDGDPDWLLWSRGGFRERLGVLRLTEVFADTGAADLGLEVGDILVGLKVRDGDGGSDWIPSRSLPRLASLIRGPDFVREEENVWILRGEESFRGHLTFDDPKLQP